MSAREPLRRAVFLDRDGTLNADSPDFVKTVDELHVFPEAGPALARLSRAGFALVVVTNQSGIARGKTTLAEVTRMHEKLRAALASHGVALLGIEVCPHGPADGCACRKPLPGMILAACARHGIDPARSYMVGDRATDVEAGRRAGCATVLIRAAEGGASWAEAAAGPDVARADLVVSGIAEAAERISSAPQPREGRACSGD